MLSSFSKSSGISGNFSYLVDKKPVVFFSMRAATLTGWVSEHIKVLKLLLPEYKSLTSLEMNKMSADAL